MVICFEEKDRAVIEAKGMTIIEFKRNLYNTEKYIKRVSEVMIRCGRMIIKAWNILKEKISEATDVIRMAIEVIKEHYHYPTSRRYKIVKVFSKCTGVNTFFAWKLAWKIKRWFVRRHCPKED